MKFLTTLALALALTFAPAAVFAASTPREPAARLIVGNGETISLFEIRAAEATTTGHCLGLDSALSTTDSAACDTLGLNQYIFPYTAKVENMRITVLGAGDAASTCVFQIEVDAANAGTASAATAVTVAGTVINVAQNFVLNEGDKVAINVADGSGCVDTTAPSFNVILEGQVLAR
jgi:hypothetical protein